MTDERTEDAARHRAPRWAVLAPVAAGCAVTAVLAFATLDPIIAAFLLILGGTAVAIAVSARDWDRHSTFEERELARARKRSAKWARNADVRARDRARWEAHQARQARQARRSDS